ncbi:MAG: hypothetical protein ABIN74_11800 [Ferruginibacter sp.]
MIIEIPKGDYDHIQLSKYCERFNCTLLKSKRGEVNYKIETDDPLNFFWLGCNWNFVYNTGLAISPAAEFLNG